MPRKNPISPQLKFITRRDGPQWRVLVQFDDLNLEAEYFGDRDYGGRERALMAAIDRRDALVEAHRIPLREYGSSGWYAKNARNTSESVGISLFLDDPERPTRVAWGASFRVNGRQQNFTRSIRKFGYHGAWRLVAAVRSKHTGQSIPGLPPAPPAWLEDWARERELDLSR